MSRAGIVGAPGVAATAAQGPTGAALPRCMVADPGGRRRHAVCGAGRRGGCQRAGEQATGTRPGAGSAGTQARAHACLRKQQRGGNQRMPTVRLHPPSLSRLLPAGPGVSEPPAAAALLQGLPRHPDAPHRARAVDAGAARHGAGAAGACLLRLGPMGPACRRPDVCHVGHPACVQGAPCPLLRRVGRARCLPWTSTLPRASARVCCWTTARAW